MNIIDQLETLGLNGRQAKVYLALLQLGSASAIEIAKYTKLKHPTVYDVLDLLREKQLVCETVSGRRRLFSPEDPARLAEIENRRKEALDAVLPDLYALYCGGEKRPRVHYYEGAEGGEALRSALLNVKAKEYFYFGAVREMLKLSTPPKYFIKTFSFILHPSSQKETTDWAKYRPVQNRRRYRAPVLRWISLQVSNLRQEPLSNRRRQ